MWLRGASHRTEPTAWKLCRTLGFSEFFQWQEAVVISDVLKLAFDYFIHTKCQKLPRLCSLAATMAPVMEGFCLASATSKQSHLRKSEEPLRQNFEK